MPGKVVPRSEVAAALDALFHPRAIAIVGVSERNPSNYGTRAEANLRQSEFAGQVFSVGQNLTAPGTFRSVADLSEGVDVAFLAIPAAGAASAVEQCGRAGIKVAVVGSAGYSETGSDVGRGYLAEVAAAATAGGVRIIGPVVSGLYNVTDGISLGYNATSPRRLRKGPVAVFGHSGALMDPIALMLEQRRCGLSLFSSTGMEIDIDVLDMAEYAIADDATKVVILILDSVDDGVRLQALATQANSAGKSIVAIKLGKSARGAEAAVAHSSRLAGNTQAYERFFRSHGIATGSTLEAATTVARLLATYGRCAPGLGIVLNSGGGAALLADCADAHGVTIPSLAPETQKRIFDLKRFPYTVTQPLNPLDLGTIDTGPEARDELPRALIEDPSIGVLLGVVLTPFTDGGFMGFAETLEDGRTEDGKPFLVLCPAGLDEGIRDGFESLGVTVIEDTEECMQGIAALTRRGPDSEVAVSERRSEEPATSADAARGAPTVGESLGEFESLQYLAAYGTPVVGMRLCSDEASVAAAASEFGWPVVLKGASGTAHKTELGLVHLNLASQTEVLEAYRAVGGGRVVVQRQVKGDCEALLGLVVRPDLGMMLVAGLGGIFAEELRDTAMWTVPASEAEINEGLRATALGRILTSPRWRWPESLPSVVSALMSLQATASRLEKEVTAIDVNPLVIGREGVIAVDALVTVGGEHARD